MNDRASNNKRAWETPTLRRHRLTSEELEKLRHSDDPIRTLLAMKPDVIKGRTT